MEIRFAERKDTGKILAFIGELAAYEGMKKNEYGQYLKDVLDGKYRDQREK